MLTQTNMATFFYYGDAFCSINFWHHNHITIYTKSTKCHQAVNNMRATLSYLTDGHLSPCRFGSHVIIDRRWVISSWNRSAGLNASWKIILWWKSSLLRIIWMRLLDIHILNCWSRRYPSHYNHPWMCSPKVPPTNDKEHNSNSTNQQNPTTIHRISR